MILLDTNALLWMINGDPMLGDGARETILANEDRRYATMVLWELSMLTDKQRIILLPSLDAWIERARVMLDMLEVPLTGAIAKEAGRLEAPIHGDPCDRIMIATAKALGCPLVTSDRRILAYAAAGHLSAIDARR